MGKLSKEDLQKLLVCIRKDSRVLVPPLPGYDAGVHFMGDKCMVVATDPCVDVPIEWFGYLLINYAASDVAVFGAKPEYCTINLLGSKSTKSISFQKIMGQVCSAAEKLNMVVVTGHTGVYEGVSKLVGVCTAYGTVPKEKLIIPGNAKAGDLILFSKSVGLELLVNFSYMHKTQAQKLFGVRRAQELETLLKSQSCVSEALLLAGLGGVNSMHDATEGGLVAALNEISDASEVGFRLEMERIPISREAEILSSYFKLNLNETLSMSSTGSILAAVNPQDKNKVEEALLRNGVSASFLGTFTKNKKRLITKNSSEMVFPRTANDPYYKIISLQS
jgi:hydrogenase expression/formation protein HypE